MQKDVCVFEISNHLVWVGDEVWRQVAAVELHAFNDFEFGFSGLGFFNRDNAFVADFLHRFSDHLADFEFAVSGDRANLSNFFRSVDLLCLLKQFSNNFSHCEVDTALEVHRVHASSNSLGTFLNDGLTENGRGCRAVTGSVVGLRSHFAQHLCAHVFELVFQFDFLGNRYTVFGDAWCAEGLVDNNVTTLRAERYLNSVSEDIDAAQHLFARIATEFYFFSSHFTLLGNIPVRLW